MIYVVSKWMVFRLIQRVLNFLYISAVSVQYCNIRLTINDTFHKANEIYDPASCLKSVHTINGAYGSNPQNRLTEVHKPRPPILAVPSNSPFL